MYPVFEGQTYALLPTWSVITIGIEIGIPQKIPVTEIEGENQALQFNIGQECQLGRGRSGLQIGEFLS